MHGDDDQIVPYADSTIYKLLKRTLEARGLPRVPGRAGKLSEVEACWPSCARGLQPGRAIVTGRAEDGERVFGPGSGKDHESAFGVSNESSALASNRFPGCTSHSCPA